MAKFHPEACAERMRRIRREKGRNDGIYAQMIEETFQPLEVSTTNAFVTSDFHIPFVDSFLLDLLLSLAEEHDVRTLFISGDVWDCDNYSAFVRLGPAVSFKEEIKNVREVMKQLLEVFKEIYICRGNHEMRWINLNGGMMDLEDLYSLLRIDGGYTVTMMITCTCFKMKNGGYYVIPEISGQLLFLWCVILQQNINAML